MKNIHVLYLFVLLILCFSAPALSIDLDTLTARQWARIPLSGTNFTGVPFNFAVDIHLSVDTSGNLYYFGGCVYGGVSGGTHNNDVFRFNIETGGSEHLYKCGTNPWPGGCQGGECYDPKRNCIWFGPGANATCRTNGVVWFPGQAYYGGHYKYQCPDGPMEKVSDNSIGSQYWRYDPVDDLVLSVGVDGYSYRPCVHVYDPNTNTFSKYMSPTSAGYHSAWQAPSCYDSKRNLIALTMWAGTGTYADITDFYFFDPTTKTWSTKSPSPYPNFTDGELAYDQENDKYIYFGGHTNPGMWVYDYDFNAWTEIPKSSSTQWPMHKFKAGFDYCAYHNVVVSLGGSGDGYDPPPTEQPQGLWVYRFGGGGGTVKEARILAHDGIALKATPNPFRTAVAISWINVRATRRVAPTVSIYNVHGRMVHALSATSDQLSAGIAWSPSDLPSGVYIAKLNLGNKTYTKRLFLQK
jgi:hypothetical protein